MRFQAALTEESFDSLSVSVGDLEQVTYVSPVGPSLPLTLR